MMLFALMLQATGVAAIGEVRELDDWLAWCPSGEACRAELAPRSGPPGLALALIRSPARAPGAATTTALVVTPPASVAAGVRTRLSVDGEVLADMQAPGGGAGLALPLDARLGPLLRRGRTLTMTTLDGRSIASASLLGMTAATAFLDRPARPAGERLTIPGVPDRKPRTLSTRDAAKLIPSQPCNTQPPGVGRAVRLDPRTSLALVAGPCGDDYILQPFVVDEKGHTRLADVDDAPAIARADWDAPAHRLLLVEERASGARCTAERRYAWTTAGRFRLAERDWRCDGRAAPIATYRARVRRG